MFNLSEYLRSQGHEVIPFSIAYQKNLPSEYESYWPKPAGGGSETKLEKLEGGIKTKLKIALRSVYSKDVRVALEKLIDEVKPDVIYCLNIVNHMSPSIIDAAHSRNLPVVMRLSDYYLVCPSYLFLRDGKVCTDCEHGFNHALKHKCIYGSMSATLCRVAGMYIHKLMRIYNKVDGFITTTNFMKDTLIRAHFQKNKIHHIPTFVNASLWTPTYTNKGYILYFGRLSPEKGVDFLLRSYSQSSTQDPLMIVGDGTEEYIEQLKSHISTERRDKVKFLGKMIGKDLQEMVYGAKYVVVPSMWYDNAPNVVYEAFAAGKPVVGTALGGLCEQVTSDTGVLVEPGNVAELSEALDRMSADAELIEQLGKAARRRVEEQNAIENHASRLLDLFTTAMIKHGRA